MNDAHLGQRTAIFPLGTLAVSLLLGCGAEGILPMPSPTETQCVTKGNCDSCELCRDGFCVWDDSCQDPCEGVTCNTPPDPFCLDADTLVTHTTRGVCRTGACEYETRQALCPSGCDPSAKTCRDCQHTCATAGLQECSDGTFHECLADARGCRAWSELAPCATGRCATATTCAKALSLNWVAESILDYGGDFYSISMANENEGFVGSAIGIMLRYHDGSWESATIQQEQNAIMGIHLVSESWGWGVALSGNVYEWSGASWNFHSQLSYGLADVLMTDANNGWIVGGETKTYRFHDGIWDEQDNPLQVAWFGAVTALDVDNVWVAGTLHYFMNWDGSSWRTWGEEEWGINDISAVSPTDIWAVGNNLVTGAGQCVIPNSECRIYHYDGHDWAVLDCPVPSPLTGVEMLSATDGWAVGADGVILHYDGNSWQSVESPTTETLCAIDMVSAKEGWAVGLNGTALHYTTRVAD